MNLSGSWDFTVSSMGVRIPVYLTASSDLI